MRSLPVRHWDAGQNLLEVWDGTDAVAAMIVKPWTKDLDLLASDLVRSPGLHASTIFGGLFEELDPDRYKYDGPANPMSLAMGTAWEKHFEYLLVKNGIEAHRPDEHLSPPIGNRQIQVAYSPDLFIFNGVLRCGEIKWTSKSVKGLPDEVTTFLPPKYDKYLAQMMLYIYWLQIEYDMEVQGWLSMALMHQAFDPQLRCYDIDFSTSDLRTNYNMCMNYAFEKGLL
jgi:hypothetical protein